MALPSYDRAVPLSAVRPADYHQTGLIPSVSLVIPTLNEAENLCHVLPQVPAWVTEVVIVDGHSTDDTVAVALRHRPDAKIVHATARGKGNALAAGFAASSGDIIIAIDADGSMDPREIYAFVGQLMSGADLVKGSRFVQGGGTVDMETHRKLGNWGLMKLVNLLFKARYSDLCYGYFAFWRDTLPLLRPDAAGFEIETLINVRALKARIIVAEVPSFEAHRIHGTSNLHAIRDGVRILRTIVRERMGRPLPDT